MTQYVEKTNLVYIKCDIIPNIIDNISHFE